MLRKSLLKNINRKIYCLLLILCICLNIVASEKFYWKISTNDKIIFLTFDDGPGKYTEEVLNILKKYNIKATFFVLGEAVKTYKNALKRIIEDKHTIGSHTYSHLNFYQLQKKYNVEQCKQILVNELLKTEHEINLVLDTPVKINLLRMPHGYYKKWMDEVLDSFNYKVVNWTAGYDWHNLEEEKMLQMYKQSLVPGGIYLFHDGGKNREKTLKVLQQFIEYCFQKGYRFGNLSEWIK